MKTLYEHNTEMNEKYGLAPRKWKGAGVLCPMCAKAESKKEVEMLQQIDIVHTQNPPRVKVRCPECKVESYKIL